MKVKIFTDFDSIKVEEFLEGMYKNYNVYEVKYSVGVCAITDKAFHSVLICYAD